ncbi:hypothetical protein V1514DRAFT_343552 [Lipomyces japonicus]|uniref:uncharacterized protein n=1 Tax=Lipomyces japonicus TaxID=56871 RepID=UPI0034CF83E3
MLSVVVEFDGYQGTFLNIASLPSYVPVFPVRHRLKKGTVGCSRIQFTLKSACTITVHKSQGMTLPKIVLDIAVKDFAFGLTYFAISHSRPQQAIAGNICMFA